MKFNKDLIKNYKCDFDFEDKRLATEKQKDFVESISDLLDLNVDLENLTFQEASDIITEYKKEYYRTKARMEREALEGYPDKW